MEKPKFKAGVEVRVTGLEKSSYGGVTRPRVGDILRTSEASVNPYVEFLDGTYAGCAHQDELELVSLPVQTPSDPALDYLKHILSDPDSRSYDYLAALRHMLHDVYGLEAVTETVFKEAF